MASPRSIVLFALAPEEDARRKPLVGAGGAQQGAMLHLHLLDRAIASAARVADADVSIVTTGDLTAVHELALRHLPPERLVVRAQEGGDFGDRLRHAVEAEFIAGRRQVVVIGTDTPELTPGHLDGAFAALDGEHCAVLGPSYDGGYYLLGFSRFSLAPFVGIRFSGGEVAADTAAALVADGYQVHLLPALRDLDRLDDAVALTRRLPRSRRRADALLLRILLDLLALRRDRRWREVATLTPRSTPRPITARGPPLTP